MYFINSLHLFESLIQLKLFFCLSNIINVTLNGNTIDKPSEEERRIAQDLADIILFLMKS